MLARTRFTLLWAAALVLAAGAVMGGSNSNQADVMAPWLPGRACSNCDLDQPTKYTCADGPYPDGYGVNAKLCVEVNDGQVSCGNGDKRTTTPQGVTNLQSDPLNCGACGTKCPDDRPACLSGTCGCNSLTLCSGNRQCDVASSRCVDCPSGTATCLGQGGFACNINLLTDVDNCGACGNRCSFGQTCTNGQCACGSTIGKCVYPNNHCNPVTSTCGDCSTPTDDSATCMKVSVLDESRYCSATGTCAQCPAGFGDCLVTQVGGSLLDDGTSTNDCETNFSTQNGNSDNCGTCGATCGKPSNTAQSCCKGQCKCGNFTNNAAPTDGECSAASTCSSTEFCDAVAKKCRPMVPFGENCLANAATYTSQTDLDSLPLCGSCDRALALKNVVNNTCLSGSAHNSACGEAQTKCRRGQTCVNGKCRCSLGNDAFSWDLGQEYDSDGNTRNILAKPAPFCNNIFVYGVISGTFARSYDSLLRLADCAQQSSAVRDRFTPADLRNETYLRLACPGTPMTCPFEFCQQVVQNLTGSYMKEFCSSAVETASNIKRCAVNYMYSGESAGDLDCANDMALRHSLVGVNTADFTWLDMFAFLGCDSSKDDFEFVFNPANRDKMFPYRSETAVKLLGSAHQMRMSPVLLVVLSFVFTLVLFTK